ncbi:hypothetical protein RB653_009646 [Dictyostelium firmibasis]|uniref:Uncharacterized protein n=1 Tax=Dictyostelium firmibasis TaxID=79012 RepID=A0AAN7U1I3_9MYCE
MRFILLIVLMFTALAAGRRLSIEESKFIAFQNKYNKIYSADEYLVKFETFKSNLLNIDALNKKAASLKSDTKFGVNKFADLSKEEFRKSYLNGKPAIMTEDLPKFPELSDDIVSVTPTAFDWRTKGAVTPVKNQGQCGSCWSFSTTGNVEGQHYLAGNTLVGLSEQNLVDCDHDCMTYDNQNVCNAGCDGGLQPNAYSYIIKNGGIDFESTYPYTAVDGECKFNPANVGAKITSYAMVPQNETQIAAYLYQHGPLAIAADAEEWQFYIGGVFDLPCGQSLDHGILIVGFSAQNTIVGKNTPYWIVKNSWGEDWGEQGYLKVERGDNKCGVSDFVSSSIISASSSSN